MHPGGDVARHLSGVVAAGALGWCVDVAVLWVAHAVLGLPVAVAAVAGFLTGGAVNFVVNREVFGGRAGAARGRAGDQWLRYGVLFAANLVLTAVLVPLLAQVAPAAVPVAPVVLAKVVLTAALVPLNALAYRTWVFAPPAPVAQGESRGAA
jgi:putative flippase GtrA